MKKTAAIRVLSALLCAWMLLQTLLLSGCFRRRRSDGGETARPETESITEAETECAHRFESDDPCEERECTLCRLRLPAAHAFELSEEESVTATLQSKGQEVYYCKLCHERKHVSLNAVQPEETDLPVLYLEGSTYGMSKDQTVTLELSYRSQERSFDCAVTMKWQGATSLRYDKKNFSIKLYEDETLEKKFKVDLGWGKENKYCLKANYVDSSHARNVVGARLYEQVIRSRANVPSRVLDAPNCGTVDGFPVLLYLNGAFYGLYTFNVPKDKWMLGMDDSESVREAILMGNEWGESCAMRQLMPADYGPDWELEHCSTEDDSWVPQSFNRLISFVMKYEGEAFRSGIGDYLDVEAAIDYLIFIYFIRAGDNGGKNVMWSTFDGRIWQPTVYDLDGTFGINWAGTPWEDEGLQMMPEKRGDTVIVQRNYHVLWNRLFACYREEIQSRYAELRADVLSLENIERTFSNFMDEIPEEIYLSDSKKWNEIPSAEENRDLDVIMDYMKKRAAAMDAFFYGL